MSPSKTFRGFKNARTGAFIFGESSKQICSLPRCLSKGFVTRDEESLRESAGEASKYGEQYDRHF